LISWGKVSVELMYVYRPTPPAFDHRRDYHLNLANDFELCDRNLVDLDGRAELSGSLLKKDLFLSPFRVRMAP